MSSLGRDRFPPNVEEHSVQSIMQLPTRSTNMNSLIKDLYWTSGIGNALLWQYLHFIEIMVYVNLFFVQMQNNSNIHGLQFPASSDSMTMDST